MRVYVDTSVVVRVIFGEPNAWPGWGDWSEACSSRLWHTEALRVLERARLETRYEPHNLLHLRKSIDLVHQHFRIFALTEAILNRAGEPFSSSLGTLDAIHLATALGIRDSYGLDALLTHDIQLANAAKAMGINVLGA